MTSLRYIYLLLAALAFGPLAGCSGADDMADVVTTPAVTQIVTFERNDAGGATFTFRRIDDSPLVTLTSDYTVDTENVPEGSRVYLEYVPQSGDPFASGRVTVQYLSRINNDVLRIAAIADYPDWNRDGVYLYSLWRTGSYLNIFCRLTYDESPRVFMLMVDESTRHDPVPQLYLVHYTREPVESFVRSYYASFDMATLWNSEECRGVDIHVANTNVTDKSVFSLRK